MAAAYLSLKEAAAYIGVTPRGLDQWVRRHGVPHVRYGNRRKFKAADLDRVMATMQARPRRKVAA